MTTNAEVTPLPPLKNKVFILIGATLYMAYCGTPYTVGAISPYIASYFGVETSQVLLLLPSIIFIQTFLMPLGGQLALRVPAKWLMALGGSIDVICTFCASYAPRDSYMAFFTLFVGGIAMSHGLSYMVPI